MLCKDALKMLLFVFNTLIFFVGATFMAIGVEVENNKKYAVGLLDKMKDLPPELGNLTYTGYILVAVGALLIFIGILGCCGTYCGNKCVLMSFSLILLVVIVAEITVVVHILFYKPKVVKMLDTIREKVAKNIKDIYGRSDIATEAWDETMFMFKCCGYNNYTDFTGSAFVSLTSQYPQFCCFTEAVQCDHARAKSEHVHGCFAAVVNLVKLKFTIIVVLASCATAFQVGAMIVVFILCKK
ncbi:tetraspanin-1-like [Tachysurus fulvidraco]|uniref:tetraspanin-1-like n=1 Tax=Tachysurus fulvidraco TaxID=1234273 RepID=UPI000F5001AC|nr:tetraspanin-1-like [Tachysurus fulvidraco]